MKKRQISAMMTGLLMLLALCLVPGMSAAGDIAWDMVSTTSQNLVSYSTDAPVFTSPGDGFQKYQVGVSESIPYGLVDDTNNGYPPDGGGVIDSATDTEEFFGVIDTVNGDNANSDPYHATWVFDISSATENVELGMDLGAMGDFEAADLYEFSYQIDGGAPTTFLTAVANEDGALTYTMADGTTRDLDDPLEVNGTPLSNVLQTFVTPISTGSQLTVTLTALADGGSEGFVVRNIVVRDNPTGQGGGTPIPTLSAAGILSLVLLLMGGGIFLIRRLY